MDRVFWPGARIQFIRAQSRAPGALQPSRIGAGIGAPRVPAYPGLGPGLGWVHFFGAGPAAPPGVSLVPQVSELAKKTRREERLPRSSRLYSFRVCLSLV